MKRACLLLVIGLSSIGPALAQESEAPGAPLAEEGYLGLALRDLPGGHTVLSWIFPGPLEGQGIRAPGLDLARPDLLVAVDGRALAAEELGEYIRGLAPGDTVTLEVRRSNRRGAAIPETLDHAEQVRALDVVLGSREEWTGTLHRGRGHAAEVQLGEGRLLDPGDAEGLLGQALVDNALVEPLEKTTDVFAEWLADNDDYHGLSRVRAAFADPFCLPELEQLVTRPTHGLGAEPFDGALRLLCENLDLDPAPALAAAEAARGFPARPLPVGDGFDFELNFAELLAGAALPAGGNDRQLALDGLSLLRVPRTTFYLEGPETRRHVGVMRRSMGVDFEGLVGAFAALSALVEVGDLLLEVPEGTAVGLPADGSLDGAVEGEVQGCSQLPGLGWLVIGGPGPNRYDTARVALVLDRGGDDEYWASDLRLGTRAIVDLGGNDRYAGTPDQGPGAALLGVSLIDDRAGDDRYEGQLLSCGAALFGVSLLLDRGGADVYVGSEWSQGAACYGAGLIVDLGQGGDSYLGDFLCQGVGGPRGFGAIVDEGGRDLYRANGSTPSAYGTPAVYQSFSQGVGFGYRQYAAGGIGLISDLGGDDRYEAGEFAQGGAYFWGLGVLHDAAGRDLYYGNRYGQGFGVHQAAGILADDGGDDCYWSMTAASQGAAWDVGVGLLIDRGGDDSYQCDGLGQGAASMQGIALLVDLDGRDRYAARGGACQGRSGGDSYHFGETGAFSFSLLMDLGGDEDWCSEGRENGAIVSTGVRDEANPQNSTLHGLCVDR